MENNTDIVKFESRLDQSFAKFKKVLILLSITVSLSFILTLIGFKSLTGIPWFGSILIVGFLFLMAGLTDFLKNGVFFVLFNIVLQICAFQTLFLIIILISPNLNNPNFHFWFIVLGTSLFSNVDRFINK